MYIIQWKKADIEKYQDILSQYLDDTGEIEMADNAIEYLTTAIQAATESSIPIKCLNPNHKPTPFNPTIKKLLQESKKVDKEWKEDGSPPYPSESYLRRKVTAKKLRREQRIQNAILREDNQERLMRACFDDTQLFYKLIRQQRKTPQTNTSEIEVDGILYKENILEGWTEHFSSLAQPLEDPFFNEEYNILVQEDCQIISLICSKIQSLHIPITTGEIDEAIQKLKNNKAKDETGLVSEHLKLGRYCLQKYLCCHSCI